MVLLSQPCVSKYVPQLWLQFLPLVRMLEYPGSNIDYKQGEYSEKSQERNLSLLKGDSKQPLPETPAQTT